MKRNLNKMSEEEIRKAFYKDFIDICIAILLSAVVITIIPIALI